MRNVCPTFKQIWEGQRALYISVVSQLPSTQNNDFAKVAYWGRHILIPFKNKAKNDYIYFQSHMKHFPIRSAKDYLIL